MCRIGYIDDEPIQFKNYQRKLKNRDSNMELILLEDCVTKEDFLDKIYDEHIDVLLIDYKMTGKYSFNGTTLLSYINENICDLDCFILTAVEGDRINDGLVAARDRYSKMIFDTEGGDPEREETLARFMDVLRESANVFCIRRDQKIEQYRELLDKKKNGKLAPGQEEADYIRLYKVLSSYGMVEKLPDEMLTSTWDKRFDDLLAVGAKILENHK